MQTHIRNTVPIISPTWGWEWGLRGISAQDLALCLGNKGHSLVWRELLKSQMIREADFAPLCLQCAWNVFIVRLSVHLCARARINYVFVRDRKQVYSGVRTLFHAALELWLAFFFMALKKTCRFLCSATRTHAHTYTHIHTHSQKAVDLVCETVFSRRDECWMLRKQSGEDERPACGCGNLILIYFSWRISCKQRRGLDGCPSHPPGSCAVKFRVHFKWPAGAGESRGTLGGGTELSWVTLICEQEAFRWLTCLS